MTKVVPQISLCLIGMSLLFALATSLANAETAACTDKALPLETPGNDKAQMQTLIMQGVDCARGGKPEKAITLFSEVIKRDPTNSVAYLNRGSTEASLGEVGLAVDDYTAAISLQPFCRGLV